MATELRNIKRKYEALEATLIAGLLPKQWGYAEDTRRIASMEDDGATVRYYWDATRLADTGGTYGTALIGSQGITGVTPTGGSSGGTGTLQAMLSGGFSGAGNTNFLATAPGSNTRNVVQPSGDFYALSLRANASQSVSLMRFESSAGAPRSTVTAAGEWATSWANAGGTNTLTVDNTDNTNAASHARHLIRSGGSTGGDPYTTWQVNAGGATSFGIDNSASDAAVWSYSTALGTSNLISSNASAMTITPAVTMSSTLWVTGTTTLAQVVSTDGFWRRSVDDGSMSFSGGSGSSAGANILLYGSTHATLANDWAFRASGSNRLYWDESASLLSLTGNLSISGTSLHTGVATFTAAPVFSSVTASQFLLVDGDKALTSVAGTGSGSVVRETSPTLVTPVLGAASGTSLTLSGDLTANRIGIGASPSYDFHIRKTASGGIVSLMENLDSTGSAQFQISSQSSGGSEINMVNGVSAGGMRLTSLVSGALRLYTDYGTVLTLASTGHTTLANSLTVNGDFIKAPVRTSDPSSPEDGMIYYNSSQGHFYFRSAGSWVEIA